MIINENRRKKKFITLNLIHNELDRISVSCVVDLFVFLVLLCVCVCVFCIIRNYHFIISLLRRATILYRNMRALDFFFFFLVHQGMLQYYTFEYCTVLINIYNLFYNISFIFPAIEFSSIYIYFFFFFFSI